MKHKLMFVNAYSQKILREEVGSKDIAENHYKTIIDFAKNSDEEIFLFSSDRKTYKARLVAHRIDKKEQEVIYKLFFTVRLAEQQVPITG